VGGDGLQCYGPSDGIPATYALGLTEDSAGNLWFGGENVKEWKPGTRVKQYLDSSEHYQFADVAVDHSGNVWAAAVGAGPRLGVRYFHNGIWSEYVAPGFHSSSVNSTGLFVDGAGAVWIGTENDGVYRVWGGVVDHFSRSEGLSGSTVASIFEDHEGNLWVTTESGVDLFRQSCLRKWEQCLRIIRVPYGLNLKRNWSFIRTEKFRKYSGGMGEFWTTIQFAQWLKIPQGPFWHSQELNFIASRNDAFRKKSLCPKVGW
jgi:ligand-binding sensor domain-containing protein